MARSNVTGIAAIGHDTSRRLPVYPQSKRKG